MIHKQKEKKKHFELNVALSYKVKNGSVKVSEKDLNKIGVGIVDEVVISSVNKKDEFTAMLFSDSKIKSGNVIISVNDARGIDLENGDRVFIKKLGDVKPVKEIKKPVLNADKKPDVKPVKEIKKPVLNADKKPDVKPKKIMGEKERSV